MLDLNRPLNECTFVAFDLETSGAYPIGHDIVEFGAIKWHQGQEVGRLQFLLKPRELMTDFIIGIHGITNEMVADAPNITEKISEIHEFVKDSVVMAHHAPFDLGFVTVDFERARLPYPVEPALCTSLLSRKWIHGVENHKLQTLVKFLNIDGGTAHRAYDDAKACLEVGLECFKRMGENPTLADAIKSQGKSLHWKDYALLHASQPPLSTLIAATYGKKDVDMIYQGGSSSGETRRVTPIGIVRNPDGDYLYAFCHREKSNKRYYLAKIKEAEEVF